MSVLVKNKNKNTGIEMVTKGAVEEVLSVCNTLELNGKNSWLRSNNDQ